MKYGVYSLKERHDLIQQVADLDDRSWPIFLQNGDAKSWKHLYDELADTVILFVNNDKVISAGFTVPIQWNNELTDLPASIEEILQRGLEIKYSNQEPDTLVPIGALVDKHYQGQGLSRAILIEMKKLAAKLNLSKLIVPVRPTHKSRYPLQSITEYTSWKNKDNQYYDPWLRVHEKLGAKIIKITASTLTVKGSLLDWSKWTNMVFPSSGEYVVPGALSTVNVDIVNNIAQYQDPNVWMQHPMS